MNKVWQTWTLYLYVTYMGVILILTKKSSIFSSNNFRRIIVLTNIDCIAIDYLNSSTGNAVYVYANSSLNYHGAKPGVYACVQIQTV